MIRLFGLKPIGSFTGIYRDPDDPLPQPPPYKGQTPGWGGVAWYRCIRCGQFTDMWLEQAAHYDREKFICRECLEKG